jgi:hypothetical protein
MKKLLALASIGLLALLTGCLAPKTVSFTSTPPGASVKYFDKASYPGYTLYDGAEIGVTPFTKEIYDQPGWYTVYEFQASKAGFQTDTQKISEKSVPDHNNVLPDTINFVLKPN